MIGYSNDMLDSYDYVPCVGNKKGKGAYQPR